MVQEWGSESVGYRGWKFKVRAQGWDSGAGGSWSECQGLGGQGWALGSVGYRRGNSVVGVVDRSPGVGFRGWGFRKWVSGVGGLSVGVQ